MQNKYTVVCESILTTSKMCQSYAHHCTGFQLNFKLNYGLQAWPSIKINRKFLMISLLDFPGGAKRLVVEISTEKVGCAAHGRGAVELLDSV